MQTHDRLYYRIKAIRQWSSSSRKSPVEKEVEDILQQADITDAGVTPKGEEMREDSESRMCSKTRP